MRNSWDRELVSLEIISAFSFQPDRWLGEVAIHLLDDQMREGLAAAKRKAELRAAVEAQIPQRLRFTRDWPTVIPTWEEAQLLADVRLQVAAVMGLVIDYTEPAAIQARYRELIEEKARREEKQVKQRGRFIPIDGHQVPA